MVGSSFKNAEGYSVLLAMVRAIQGSKAYLSDVDGQIGDGDHGANMNKGFTVFEERSGSTRPSFSEGLSQLAMILLNEIGGSMGPIYGTIFMELADATAGSERIDLECFTAALSAGLEGLYEIVQARTGDKTLVDTLSPAVSALQEKVQSGASFAEALEAMKSAAQSGRDSTKDMIAKYGRSSRLGERSRGVLDAGACSCCILLLAMADGILSLLEGETQA